MSDIDPAKLKVVELRAELTARGLDSKGNKPVLVDRLKEALEKERMGGDEEGEEEEAEGEEEESAEEEEGSEEEEEPPEPVQTKTPPVVEKELEPAKAPNQDKSLEPVVVLTQVKASESTKPPPVKTPEPVKVPTPVKSPEPVKVPTPVKSPEPVKATPPVKSPEPAKAAPAVSPQKTAPAVSPQKTAPAVSPQKTAPAVSPQKTAPAVSPQKTAPAASPQKTAPVASPQKTAPVVVKAEPVVEDKKDKSAPMTKPESNQDKPGVKTEEPMETDIKTEPKESEKKNDSKFECKADPKLLPKEGEQYPVLELSQWEDKPKIDRGEPATPDRSRKRGREESPESESPRKGQEEDEPEYDEKAVMLSWYDSDLNIKVDKSDFLSATPMHEEGFAYIWAGTRATYGVIRGQAFFEVKITKHLDVSHLVNEEYPHVVRVGWSVPSASMQLGEEALSFGYGGTAKVSCNNKFRDFGKQFQEGDVVGTFLDMSGDTVRISFCVNGQDQGVAFEVPSGKLNGSALFPHVVSKNSSFTCNFGAADPWFPPPEGYSTYVAVANMNKETELVPGPKRPASKGDCEMLMMCGLSGSGKTYWANKHCQNHPERNYNILGTNNLIDKMKVMGLSRRRNYHGRWEELIAQCTQCLNKLLVIAATRRRNYILDQTNVYPSAQRRKMRPFEGFVRQAIVIVPSEDDFKQRCTQREQEEGKDVPDSANLEMKGNFQLPVKSDLFSEVRYEELKEDRARELVAKYNKEAADAGFGPSAPKRGRGYDNNRPSRFTDRTDHRSESGSRGGGGGGRYGDHNRSDNRDRGGWGRDRGGGGGGGWRDNRHGGGGGGYRGRDGGGGGGWRGGNRDRDRGGDSRSYGRSDYGGRGGGGGGYDRNRSRDGDRKDRWGGGSQGGSWQSGGQGGGWQGSSGNWQGSQGGWQGQQQRGGYGQQQGSYGQTNTYNQSSYGTPASNTAAQSYGTYGSYGQQQQQQQQGYAAYGQQAYAGWNQQQAQSGYGAYQATAAATGTTAQQPQQQSYAQYSGYQQAAQPAQQQTQTQQSYSSSGTK